MVDAIDLFQVARGKDAVRKDEVEAHEGRGAIWGCQVG